jgi:hypothetical protein
LNENGDKETMKAFTFKISNKKTTYDIENQGLAFAFGTDTKMWRD